MRLGCRAKIRPAGVWAEEYTVWGSNVRSWLVRARGTGGGTVHTSRRKLLESGRLKQATASAIMTMLPADLRERVLSLKLPQALTAIFATQEGEVIPAFLKASLLIGEVPES